MNAISSRLQIHRWRLEGPFDSSYSLALVNRELARALARQGQIVALHSSEGPGDFLPQSAFLAKHPDLALMHHRCQEIGPSRADVLSRNMFPPRVSDMVGPLNILHTYAWEETGFPSEWVTQFNQYLQGISVTSTHVKKVLLDQGVLVPIEVNHLGVDHWLHIDASDPPRIPLKSFRFLHISSCFPRKGVKEMLQAFGDAFTAKDDVCLVIKTFSNPHQQVHQWLEQCQSRHASYPQVIVIEEDLNETVLKGLVESCHVLVAPSLAEGFALPLAEAMLSGLAVITTGWGGQLEFCDAQSAWLVDYELIAAHSHLSGFDSVWAQPKVDHLSQLMREIHGLPTSERMKKAQHGKKRLLSEFTWDQSAKGLMASVNRWSTQQAPVSLNLGWISTWGTRCGIAKYSEHLTTAMGADLHVFANQVANLESPPERFVSRVWKDNNQDDLTGLLSAVDRTNINVLIVQFNYGFFNFECFKHFLKSLHERKITVLVFMHCTIDLPNQPNKKLRYIRAELHQCARIMVHTIHDLNQLKNTGLVENVTLFPHGVLPRLKRKRVNVPQKTFRIATYGFFLPHKGLIEIVEGLKMLKDSGVSISLHMLNAKYPVPESEWLIQEVEKRIDALGLRQDIHLCTDFLSDQVCLEKLAEMDLIVYPYQSTNESTSGAVRYGIASGTPVAVTPLSIFDDVSEAVYPLPGTSPAQLAQGIHRFILDNSQMKLDELHTRAARWHEAHTYEKLGKRLHHIVQSLHRDALQQHDIKKSRRYTP